MSYSIGSEPDPFGALVAASGNSAYDNPFRFSTKYADDETSLLYYGYRYLAPGMGRWTRRDPLGERGGRNLHAFAGNRTVTAVDVLGREGVVPGDAGKECEWNLYLGHTMDVGLLGLKDWLLGNTEPEVACGDNKIAFGTCSSEYLSDQVREGHSIPIPPDMLVISEDEVSQEDIDSANAALDADPVFGDLPDMTAENATYSEFGAAEALLMNRYIQDEARTQCTRPGNCCKTITISVHCSDQLSNTIDRNIAGFSGLKPLPKELLMFAGAENPCGKSFKVTCDE